MDFSAIFIFAVWTALIAHLTFGKERERAMLFPDYYFLAERRLVYHTIETRKVKSLDDCELYCYLEDNCVSLNFKNDPENIGAGHICELNNATHLKYEGDLTTDAFFYYRGSENSCDKYSQCRNNATCQSGFTLKGYRCLCSSGFQGELCENDFDGCKTASSKCHVNATCDNTHGSYVCKCKPGYTGDGKNCTDVDECKGNHSCHENANCTNTIESHVCECHPGYTGNGRNCTAFSTPLGMDNQVKLIKDAQISASSEWDANHAAIQGRLNFLAAQGKQGGWSAKYNNVNQWIQVDLLTETTVTQIATQGRNDHNQWVKKYKVQYNDGGANLSFYQIPGQNSPKEFIANQDSNTVVSQQLYPFIRARYVRLLPTDWHNHISLRMELYGCEPDSCENYKTLSDSERNNATSTIGQGSCDDYFPDNNQSEEWYRFIGDAGTKMPTTRVNAYHCGVVWSGWLDGAHPTVEDGEVSRMVCFSDRSAPNCRYLITIAVKNCGAYFIYKLFRPPGCNSRYCGTD